MTSTRSGKTPDASPSPPPPDAAPAGERGDDDAMTARRGLAIAQACLGAGELPSGPSRRARAEALAAAMLTLRAAVARETLA